MKKILASLLVLAMCAPAMALTFSTSDQGDGVLRISYDLDQAASEGLRGLALTLSVTAGNGAVADNTKCAAGLFNTFIDFAADVDNTYTAVGQGHPFALITPDVTNGEYELETFPATSFALSMGFLDTTAGQAAIVDDGFIDVEFDGTINTTVAVALDTLRGGAVGDNLTVGAMPAPQVLVFAQTCADKFAGNALYAAYVAAGKDPSCWCWKYQCRGDANGAVDYPALNWRIYTADLGIISSNWRKGPASGADPRADINHAVDYPALNWAIYTADLGIVSTNWRKGDTTLVTCPEYIE